MRLKACLAALFLTLAAPAAAQTTTEPGLAIADISSWISSKGGQVQPVERQDGETWLTVQDGPLTWFVFLYGCRQDICSDLQFSTSFTNEAVTAERVNAWNREHRFLKAYHEPGEAGGPSTAVVQYDLLLQPGGIDQLNDPTGVWVSLLQEFARYMGYLPAAPSNPEGSGS
jgi:hypothetical protein